MSLSRGSQPDQQIKKERLLSGYNSKAIFKKAMQKISDDSLDFVFVLCLSITAIGELFGRQFSGKWYFVVGLITIVEIVKKIVYPHFFPIISTLEPQDEFATKKLQIHIEDLKKKVVDLEKVEDTKQSLELKQEIKATKQKYIDLIDIIKAKKLSKAKMSIESRNDEIKESCYNKDGYGIYSYKSQKHDGSFEDHVIFKKEKNESWETALKKSLKNLQETDGRLNNPVIVTFFAKL